MEQANKEEKQDPTENKTDSILNKDLKEVLSSDEKEENKEVIIPQVTENMSMICPLCHFFMYKSVCACCGHMFCQFCLDEYLIFKDSCPVCEKTIRRGKITRCCVADSAIDKIISFHQAKIVKEWDCKKKREDDYYANKKIDDISGIFEAMNNKDRDQKEILIDARDSEYIWCKAEVMATIESKDKDNSILVHYKGWGRKYDEVLTLNSPRIAKTGFYTSREDIPRYQETDNKSKKPVVNLPASNEKIQIIEELKKDCFKINETGGEGTTCGEPGDELLNEEDVYEYLIDKVSSQNRGGSREIRSVNPQSSFLHIPPGNRGNDVRIRVSTSNLNRLRSVFNRTYF